MPHRHRTNPEGIVALDAARPRSAPGLEPLTEERSRPNGDLYLAALAGAATEEQRQRITETHVARALTALDDVRRESIETKAAAVESVVASKASLVEARAAREEVRELYEVVGQLLAELASHGRRLTAREIATYAVGIGAGVGLIEGVLWLVRH